MRKCPAPSTRAASISERGIVRKNDASRKVENGSSRPMYTNTTAR